MKKQLKKSFQHHRIKERRKEVKQRSEARRKNYFVIVVEIDLLIFFCGCGCFG